MRKMVTFRSNRECRDIAVNPDQVLWVCHYEHNACTLHFGKECFVRVHGNIADVIRKLEGEPDRSSDPGTQVVGATGSHASEIH